MDAEVIYSFSLFIYLILNFDRPVGTVASYFLNVAAMLSDTSNEAEEQNSRRKKISKICKALRLSNDELEQCRHPTDITKTCRHIVKRLYPSLTERAKLKVSKISSRRLQAIHGKSYRQSGENYISCFRLCTINSSRSI